jgi:uncharacterized protein
MQTEAAHPTSRIWKIIQFPLSRITIALVFVFTAIGIAQVIASLNHSAPFLRLVSLLAIVLVYTAYRSYVGLIEKRAVRELSFSGVGKELGFGLLVGSGLFTLTISILWLLGYYQVTGFGGWSALWVGLALSSQGGFIEEVLFRGIIFRITEEWLGTYLALVISALLFGLAHAFNSNATVISTLAITLEAGLLLAAAYLLTRRLWFPIGLHIAWNYTQGNLFGVAVSGNKASGLLQARLVGPSLISGGNFDAEASGVAVIVCLVAFALLFNRAKQKGRFVSPFWINKETLQANSKSEVA